MFMKLFLFFLQYQITVNVSFLGFNIIFCAVHDRHPNCLGLTGAVPVSTILSRCPGLLSFCPGFLATMCTTYVFRNNEVNYVRSMLLFIAGTGNSMMKIYITWF